MSFRYGGLFSGVGGLEIAAEMCGGEPVFMCEQDLFCQRILRRRFPGVPIIDDVRDVGPEWEVDGLVGGFPCQDISSAGQGAGITGERSGLWKEFFRVISILRPKVVLIENVALLRSRGLSTVLYDLHSIGYHAEWDVIPAAAVGAPHLRERIWIIARPAELAAEPVYGEPTGETFGFVSKLPRAGRMGEQFEELTPVAPRKTKRQDGWTYWTGVNLFAHAPSGPLWPSSSARDYKDVGDLNCVPDNGLLPRRVFHVETGNRLLPTPKATDADRGCRGDLIQVVRGNQSPSGHYAARLWPTMHGMPTDGNPRRQGPSGNELGSKVNQTERALWPTTTARLGDNRGAQAKRFFNPARSNDLDDAVAARTKVNGSLNPTWTEWLMGLPLWWTDPEVPTAFTTHVGWDHEPLHVAPRIATGVKLRSARLKAIGNGVVWPCAYYALERAIAATPAVWSDAQAEAA